MRPSGPWVGRVLVPSGSPMRVRHRLCGVPKVAVVHGSLCPDASRVQAALLPIVAICVGRLMLCPGNARAGVPKS